MQCIKTTCLVTAVLIFSTGLGQEQDTTASDTITGEKKVQHLELDSIVLSGTERHPPVCQLLPEYTFIRQTLKMIQEDLCSMSPGKCSW